MHLAVLGHPLRHTRSPDLHRAGLAALGIEGESRAVPTLPEDLGATLETLAREGLVGVNLTHPLKEAVIARLDRVSDAARVARSVNTVGFDAAGWWGDTTDGPGFLDFLAAVDARDAIERVLFLGAGGAARSLAASLLSEGARVSVMARNPAAARAAWDGLPGARLLHWQVELDRVLAEASLVVNATPLTAPEDGLPVEPVPRTAVAVDLVYGPEPTRWTLALRSRGVRAHDGLGLLVHQARLSLHAWTGREVPVEPLAAAVDWTP